VKRMLAWVIITTLAMVVSSIVAGALVTAIYAAYHGDTGARIALAWVGGMAAIIGVARALIWALDEVES
jgi:hypothetical protein